MKTVLRIMLTCGMLAGVAEPSDLATVFSQPYLSGSTPNRVVWSPNDSLIAFLWNDQGGEFQNLWVVNPQTGQVERLTNFNPEMSADVLSIGTLGWLTNRSIFFEFRGDIWEATLLHQRTLKRIEGISECTEPIGLSPDRKYLTYNRHGNLMLYELASGNGQVIFPEINRNRSSARRITSQQTDYRWSCRGDRIAVYLEPESGEAAVCFKVLDVKTGAWDEIVIKDQPKRSSIVRDFIWSPNDQFLVYESVTHNLRERYIVRIDLIEHQLDTLYREVRDTWAPDFGYRLYWIEPEAKILFGMEVNSYNHLFILDPADGRYSAITRGQWNVKDYIVDAIGQLIYFTGTKDRADQLQLYVAHIKTAEIDNISYRGGDYSFWLSNDEQKIAEVFSNQNTPPDLYWINAMPRSKMNPITVRPESALGKLQGKIPKNGVVHYEPTKRTINYKMWLPNETLATQKYPVIIVLNGTDCAAATTEAWRPEWYFLQWMSDQGYITIAMEYTDLRTAMNLSGQPPLNDPLSAQLSEIKAVVREVSKLDYVDKSRIGICGWGYGGYLASMAMFKETTTFRSGAAILSDLSWSQPNRHYLNYLTSLLVANHRILPHIDPQQVYHNLSGRLLILQGADAALPQLMEANQLIPDLLNQRKFVDFYLYPWESGNIRRGVDQYDLFRKTARFFQENL
ncbi:MAG: DPP IV N-terminal domain-containing protein [Candidatus Marinimicrobia bacterium]|nr:DPP IV N-terminal domain-containing protein [Candidatus Neomarinimicrobiota bacterium]